MIPILSVRGLTKVFEIPKREPITAVSNVTFDLAAARRLASSAIPAAEKVRSCGSSCV